MYVSKSIENLRYSVIREMGQLAALDLDEAVLSEMAGIFQRRVDLVCSRLEAMPGIRVKRPQGSFYVFVDVSAVSSGSREFALSLVEEEHLVVVPGYAFGASCDGCIRIACTLPEERLQDAMDRLERFLTRQPKRESHAPA